MLRILRGLKNKLKSQPNKNTSFEFTHSSSFHTTTLDNAVFIDNRFPNGFDQVLHYFASGFFQANTTCVIFKYYDSNYRNIVNSCDARNVQWFCFANNRFIPKLENMLILYPFNSASNAKLVENRSCYHVLLMHGESNKVGSIKPLARLYDYILVAGDIACDRLVEYGILTYDDFTRGRIIKFGDTVLGDFEKLQMSSNTKETTRALGYFPTWEGGNNEEDLCSLEYALPAITAALKAKDINKVILRFHPHTGQRITDYKTYAQEIVVALIEHGIEITYPVINQPTDFELLLMSLYPSIYWHQADNNLPIEVSMAIVDVSALEAVLDAKSIQNIVLIIKGKFIAAPKNYWKLKGQRHFIVPGEVFPIDIFKETVDPTQIYKDVLISYSDQSLKSMSHEGRMIWLNNYVRNTERSLG